MAEASFYQKERGTMTTMNNIHYLYDWYYCRLYQTTSD